MLAPRADSDQPGLDTEVVRDRGQVVAGLLRQILLAAAVADLDLESGQLLALGSALGLVVVSGLIAHEIWPGHPGRALATAGFVLAYPVVLRLGALFHPETTMAFL